MLVVFISVFSVMVITMLIMAIGVMFGRAPIKGSCGGLGAIGVERACGCVDVCQNEMSVQTDTVSDTTNSSKASVEVYRP